MLTRLLGALGLERKSTSVSFSDPAIEALINCNPTASGISVGPDTALRCAPVLSCVRLISESVGGLPLVLYRENKDGGKDRAADDPLYALLHDQPNEWQSAVEFKTGMTAALVVHGYAAAYVGRDVTGRPVELIQLPSRNISVRIDAVTMAPTFVASFADGRQREFDRSELLYLAIPGAEPWRPLSPVIQAKEAIGLCLVLESFCASLFGRGAKPSGVLKLKKKATAEILTKLRTSFSNVYGGPGGERTAILEEDQDFQQLQLSSVDSQTLEMRHFAVAEIARAFRVPPHMLGELERATHSNAETLGREFISYTLKTYLEIWEGAVRLSLIDPADRGSLHAEFLTEDLLRGDIQSRFAAYQSAILSGWMTGNEVRALENRPALPGSDVLRAPVNTAPVGGPNVGA